MGFNIGDRVVSLVNYPDGNYDIRVGSTGVVCKVELDGYGPIGVCWNDKVSGHDCGGYCEYGHGWNVDPKYIEIDDSYDEPFEFDEGKFRQLLLG